MLEWFKSWFLGLSGQLLGMAAYYAAPLMIFVGALDSSLLSLPEVNDYITIARVTRNPSEVYYFPLFPALGSVIGCYLLYKIAQRGEQFLTKKFNPQHLERVKKIYKKWGIFALVIPAFLPPPMPFKIFVAVAGALNYPIRRFLAVVMISRTIRYYMWGILAYFYRDQVERIFIWLETNFYLVLGVSIATVLAVVVIRWIASRYHSESEESKAQISYTD